MRADGNAGAAVVARVGIELPDPDAVPLVVRTWNPSPVAPARHSPNCRSRCCGSWQLSLPVPTRAPLPGGDGQAPAPTAPEETPQERAREVSAQPRGELPAPSAVPAPRSSGRAKARRGLVCAAGCGVPLDPGWAARTGRDRHGWCLGSATQPAAGSAGGAR